jgi:3-hydroxybutyryl-CoA dehydrogenase
VEHILGVLGTGTMGADIVQLAAQSGYRVLACDASVEALERAQVCVDGGLSHLDQWGIFPEGEASSHYDRIHWTTNPEQLRDAPAVLETIVEKVEPKKEQYSTIPKWASGHRLQASART